MKGLGFCSAGDGMRGLLTPRPCTVAKLWAMMYVCVCVRVHKYKYKYKYIYIYKHARG